MGRHLYLGQDFSDFYQIQIPCRRQLQAAAHPAKQQVLQQLFELRDLFADCALGQIQLFGRTGETQMTGHRFKTLQRRDRR